MMKWAENSPYPVVAIFLAFLFAAQKAAQIVRASRAALPLQCRPRLCGVHENMNFNAGVDLNVPSA
jgi:hypothetical protein